MFLIRGAKNLHKSLLDSIIKCKLQFFESTPAGRILNRFSQDMELSESRIPESFRSLALCFFTILTSIIAISMTTPFFLIMVVPLAVVYYVFKVCCKF